MTAIASLLSTTAVTLPGAPAPIGVTTLAPFPDLALAQTQAAAGSGTTVAPASGRQAAADAGKALPVAQGDADALAWLDPALADVGGATDPVARAGAAASSPRESSPIASTRATIVTAAFEAPESLVGYQPAPMADVETVAVARPTAASTGRPAVVPVRTSEGDAALPITDTASIVAPAEAADDGAGDEAQQPVAGWSADLAPPATTSPAAMPSITPAPIAQGSKGPVEQSEASRPSSTVSQPVRLVPRADEAPSIALSVAPQPAGATVPHADSLLVASAPATPATTSQRAGAVFATVATPTPDHALAQPASPAGAPIRPARVIAPSDVADVTAAPLSNEARGSTLPIGATPATASRGDGAATVPMADRAASSATLTSAQVPAGVPQSVSDLALPVRADTAEAVMAKDLRGTVDRGDLRAPASGAATSTSVADASGLPGLNDAPEPSRLHGSRPSAQREASGSARAQTLVASLDAHVPLIGGTPLPIAAPAGPAVAISSGAEPSRLSPAPARVVRFDTVTDAARGVAMPTMIARDPTTPLASAAASPTAPALSGLVTEAPAPTVSIAVPSIGAAVSFAPPVHAAAGAPQPVAFTAPLTPPVAGAATTEQSIARASAAPDAAVRDAAPAAPASRVAADLPAPVLRPTSAPAAQVFAAAIHRALGEQDTRQPGDLAPPLAPLAPVMPGVAATGTVQQGALDMRHEHWPAVMIERIVTLRDMAAENDTRLRLSPDMLGTIDVSLKRDGDQVQVQITAEQAQTRQLLADAQPRLAEMADARGVKLQLTGGHGGSGAGQPGTGTGPGHGSGGDAPRQQTPASPFPTRPRSGAERAGADDPEQRIA